MSNAKILVMALCAAMVVMASSADARRLGGGRSIGAKMTETASLTGRAEASTVGATVKVESAGARALTGADMKAAVLTGVAAGTARAAVRNANAEEAANGSGARADQQADAAGGRNMQGLQSVSYQSRMSDRKPSKDPDLDRERAAEALAMRLFDQSAEKAVELMEQPKTAAEIAREKKEAEEKALAKKIEDARKMKLAREQSCRIEPVMTDKAIANCLKVFREPS